MDNFSFIIGMFLPTFLYLLDAEVKPDSHQVVNLSRKIGDFLNLLKMCEKIKTMNLFFITLIKAFLNEGHNVECMKMHR